MYAMSTDKAYKIKIVMTIKVVGKPPYLKRHTSWIRSLETSNPSQPLSKSGTSTEKQMGMRHNAGMGLRKTEYSVKTT